MAEAPKVAFKTLGCRLNQAESEQALEALGARGFDLAHAGEQPDVVVINTCTVTAESTASSRRLIRKTAEANPQATVVVTGCYAVADPEAVRAIPGVDLVVDNDSKDRLAELVTAVPSVRRLPLLHRPAPTERLRTRVAIKAQTGCDEWCTFCIIPRTRGPLRSYPEAQIVDDVRRQVDRGVREVVLTGVHLGKYGDDRGETDALARLVDQVRPRFVAVAGDVRALQLLREQAPKRVRELLTVVGGEYASLDAVFAEADKLVAATVEADGRAVLERFAEELGQAAAGGQAGGLAVEGAAATLDALGRGQVATLLLTGLFLDDQRTAWFGPAPTDVAADRDALAGLGVPGPVQGRLVDVAVRAALGTGAEVRVLDSADETRPAADRGATHDAPAPPEHAPRDGLGALLRFPLGS
jgi:hypothetical protein